MNAELASIKDVTRNNQAAGKIRLQWWRERIYDLYALPSSSFASSGPSRPDTLLLRALGQAIQKHNLTRRWFERLLDAREEDLDVEHFEKIEDLEIYAEKTASSLLYLTLECLNIRDNLSDRVARYWIHNKPQ